MPLRRCGCTVLIARSSGLGLATTKLLSEQGANIAVLDIQEHPNPSGQIHFWECDVSNDDRVGECINEAIEWAKQQNKPLGGAVCCAGVGMVGRVQCPPDPTD
jgi:3-hydroxyacyl-CoA dehydrogenase / 3-hydroxy-2-methylbutyryl-CoA dehydrogenase